MLSIIPKNKTLGKVGNEQHGERLLPRIISDEKARPVIFQPFRPIYKLTRILETNRPIRETPRHDRGTHTERFNFIRPSPVRLQKLSHFTSRGTVPHRITSSFLPRSQRDQTERLEFRSCLENLREKGREGSFFMAFIRKNGVTSGFEWLRKLPGGIANKRIRDTLYPPLPEDRSMRCDRRESCIFVHHVYRHLSIVIIEKHRRKETWYFNERCSIFRRTSNSGCKQRCASIDSRF